MNGTESGAPEFSKGVHDHYAHYADNADAKIGALFGINLAVAGLLLGNVPDECVAATLGWVAVAGNGITGGVLLYGIYPRVSSGAPSLHWEKVQKEPSPQAYADSVATVSPEAADRLYAENNFHVAGVLHRKFLAIRFSIWLTASALAFAVASVIAR
jgi:hypothetical protein